MSNRNPKTSSSNGGDDGSGSSNEEVFDWSTVFPTSKIKTHLHRQSDDISCLPKKTLELISTCSALILRKIVQEAALISQETKNSSSSGNERSTSTTAAVVVINAKDIKNAVERNESFYFAQDTLEEIAVKDDRKLVNASEKSSDHKRKLSPTKPVESSRPRKKVVKELTNLSGKNDDAINHASMKEVLQVADISSSSNNNDNKEFASLRNEIVVDEEDYD